VRDLERVIDPAVIVHGGKILFQLGSDIMAERLGAAHVSELGPDVVYAEKDRVGYSALLELGRGAGSDDVQAADLELVFNAAITVPDRLETALKGEQLPQLGPADAAVKEYSEKEETK
jgi:hypothetical protein